MRSRTHAERAASTDGYFAPRSVIRRILGSPVSLLGGGPAVLFQVAHPLVAASIVAETDYREGLRRRWLRTWRAGYAIVFGTREEADRAGAHVRAIHARATGVTREQLGPYPSGTPFAAGDPELMVWVHAALVEVGLAEYSRFVRPLDDDERRQFYNEMAVFADVVGIPPQAIPPTLDDLRAFVETQIATGRAVVTDPAREVARAVLTAIPRPFAVLHRLATAGLLPPALREQYGLPWGPGRDVALRVAATSYCLGAMPFLLAAERLPVTGGDGTGRLAPARVRRDIRSS
jgi:uncharacterized protein (DUF2236 family)